MGLSKHGSAQLIRFRGAVYRRVTAEPIRQMQSPVSEKELVLRGIRDWLTGLREFLYLARRGPGSDDAVVSGSALVQQIAQVDKSIKELGWLAHTCR